MTALFLLLIFIMFSGSFLIQNLNTPTEMKKEIVRVTPSPAVAGVTDVLMTPTPFVIISQSAMPSNTTIRTNREVARVVKVVDGDTIQLEGNRTLRYIGIDTPETVDPRRPFQCFGKEASARNKELVEGKVVGLEKDVSETDKYGRLLRYVYLEDTLINEQLVREGFAVASSYPPDVKMNQQFKLAEEQARQSTAGLWGSCVDAITKAPRPGGGASTSSGDKDCSDFMTQSEAQAYFDIKGGSTTNNVDRLDGSDNDGRVCETLP